MYRFALVFISFLSRRSSCKMHRGSKVRSRGGGRGGEGGRGGRGGRGGSMSRGRGINQVARKSRDGSYDSSSLCVGAISGPMASTPRCSRGGRVGSKGRGTFFSTVGSKSFR